MHYQTVCFHVDSLDLSTVSSPVYSMQRKQLTTTKVYPSARSNINYHLARQDKWLGVGGWRRKKKKNTLIRQQKYWSSVTNEQVRKVKRDKPRKICLNFHSTSWRSLAISSCAGGCWVKSWKEKQVNCLAISYSNHLFYLHMKSIPGEGTLFLQHDEELRTLHEY